MVVPAEPLRVDAREIRRGSILAAVTAISIALTTRLSRTSPRDSLGAKRRHAEARPSATHVARPEVASYGRVLVATAATIYGESSVRSWRALAIFAHRSALIYAA